MNDRITPQFVKELHENEIFVFGSNLSGIHGKGAAKFAMKHGAKYYQAYGLQGNTFAIPTKDKLIMHTLGLDVIEQYVIKFIKFAQSNPQYKFLVTEIGCGLAGLTPKEIAPLFKNAISVNNIYLPYTFWNILK